MTTSPSRGYSMTEAAELLGGCSRAHLYNLVARGELQVVKVGHRTLVPASEIDRLLTVPDKPHGDAA